MTARPTKRQATDYLSLREAAERYQISALTLRRRIRTGGLPAVRSGSRRIRVRSPPRSAIQASPQRHLVAMMGTVGARENPRHWALSRPAISLEAVEEVSTRVRPRALPGRPPLRDAVQPRRAPPARRRCHPPPRDRLMGPGRDRRTCPLQTASRRSARTSSVKAPATSRKLNSTRACSLASDRAPTAQAMPPLAG